MRQTRYGRIPGPTGFTFQLEQQPHNLMHVEVGGEGWMSDPRMAARDPIFWLHHANIDRLWKRWIQLEGGRTNPTADPTWMNSKFAFYDEEKRRVEMTGAQVLETVPQLDYRYDDDPPLIVVAGQDRPPGEAAAPVQELASATDVTLTRADRC